MDSCGIKNAGEFQKNLVSQSIKNGTRRSQSSNSESIQTMRSFSSFCTIYWLYHFDHTQAFAINSVRATTNRLSSTAILAPRQSFSILSTLTGKDFSENPQQTSAWIKRRWSDFLYGADFVNSRYLTLFWEYNFRRTIIPWVLPFLIVLVGTQMLSPSIGSTTFGILKNVCTVVFLLAGTLGGILQLPFDAVRWTISLTPALVVPILDYLPSKFAIQMVKVLLDLHSAMNYLAQTSFLTGLAVLLWRPMVEEIQYRYLLGKFLGNGRNHQQPKVNGESKSMVHFIAVDGSSVLDPQFQNASDSPSSVTDRPTPQSPRLLFSSFAFAFTRLGWLCAVPTTMDYVYPFLQTATSSYSWTVAFMQSTIAHFSSWGLSELSPLLQRSLLLLAIQQTVSTFFVTWYVFVPLYLERGILASMGAHMAWTLGKMTWLLRLVWMAIQRIPFNENVVPVAKNTLLNRKR